MMEEKLEKHRAFLVDGIDPDFGLLDKLFANDTLTKEEIHKIKLKDNTTEDRNRKLIDFVLSNKTAEELVTALNESGQSHLVNYLKADGEYSEDYGDDWPLDSSRIKILKCNHESLVDLIDTSELCNQLWSIKVINSRQKDFVRSKSTDAEKNEAFLEILSKCSLRCYKKTIDCLCISKQKHVADILSKGGVVLQVHARLGGDIADVDAAEDALVSTMTTLLDNRSLDEVERVLGLVRLRAIRARKGHSVVIYFHLIIIDHWTCLIHLLHNGELRKVIEMIFNHLLFNLGDVIKITLDWSQEDIKRGSEYFGPLYCGKGSLMRVSKEPKSKITQTASSQLRSLHQRPLTSPHLESGSNSSNLLPMSPETVKKDVQKISVRQTFAKIFKFLDSGLQTDISTKIMCLCQMLLQSGDILNTNFRNRIPAILFQYFVSGKTDLEELEHLKIKSALFEKTMLMNVSLAENLERVMNELECHTDLVQRLEIQQGEVKRELSAKELQCHELKEQMNSTQIEVNTLTETLKTTRMMNVSLAGDLQIAKNELERQNTLVTKRKLQRDEAHEDILDMTKKTKRMEIAKDEKDIGKKELLKTKPHLGLPFIRDFSKDIENKLKEHQREKDLEVTLNQSLEHLTKLKSEYGLGVPRVNILGWKEKDKEMETVVKDVKYPEFRYRTTRVSDLQYIPALETEEQEDSARGGSQPARGFLEERKLAVTNNFQFLMENMKPIPLLDRLFSKLCITGQEREALNNQPNDFYRNGEILQWMKCFIAKISWEIVFDCLRETGQNFIADMLAKGKVSVKCKISSKFDTSTFVWNQPPILTSQNILKQKEVSLVMMLNQSKKISTFEKMDYKLDVAPFCRCVSDGIVVWFSVDSQPVLKKLQSDYECGLLLNTMMSVFNDLLQEADVSTANWILIPQTLTIFEDEFEKLTEISNVKHQSMPYPYAIPMPLLHFPSLSFTNPGLMDATFATMPRKHSLHSFTATRTGLISDEDESRPSTLIQGWIAPPDPDK